MSRVEHEKKFYYLGACCLQPVRLLTTSYYKSYYFQNIKHKMILNNTWKVL